MTNMKNRKQIICMKWGSMYGPEYVNNLYGMIERNLSYPFDLFCMTDSRKGIRNEVECLPLPELGFDVPPQAPGKWPKQALWAKDLFGLRGVVLFLDLDSVIVDDMDGYFEYGSDEDVITARNWIKPWVRGAQTSVFRYKIGSHSYLLDQLRENPKLCVTYQFEQNYVTQTVKGGVKFWPAGWTKHFRRHCMGPWPCRYLRAPCLPKGCKIVTFPGSPKPPDAIMGRWNAQAKNLSPTDHLKEVMVTKGSKERKKLLRRYVRSTKWVAQHWAA